MDTRSKDSIRNTEQKVVALALRVEELMEDIEVLTRIARDIKRSVVRKYEWKKDES